MVWKLDIVLAFRSLSAGKIGAEADTGSCGIISKDSDMSGIASREELGNEWELEMYP